MLRQSNRFFFMGSLEASGGENKIDPTSMPGADPIIGMNLSSSQTELVQSGGLGHSGHTIGAILHYAKSQGLHKVGD
jgi:hypothetical protein